jgi:hypothetical protein
MVLELGAELAHAPELFFVVLTHRQG